MQQPGGQQGQQHAFVFDGFAWLRRFFSMVFMALLSFHTYAHAYMTLEQAQHICQDEYVYTVDMQRRDVSLDQFFRALADPTRLRLLNLIADREICVCFFVEILGVSQPKISRHLAYLRKAGLVASRREGKWMHYRLAQPKDEVAQDILRSTIRKLAAKPEMQRDVSKLGSACCAPNGLVPLAPRPAKLAH